MTQLTYRGFQPPRVRKNLCNIVAVADPTTTAGLEALQVCAYDTCDVDACVVVVVVILSIKQVEWRPNRYRLSLSPGGEI